LTLRKYPLLGARLCLVILLACCVPTGKAQTWERLGPEGGNVISLAASSDGSVFLGTTDGHVYASRDAAAHWELRGRVGSRLDGVIQRLLVDVRNPQRVFAAVWFQDPAADGGIFRSEDGGRSWRASGLQGEAARALEQSPSQPDSFVAGTRTGVFRSEDSGLTWERISPAGDDELKNIDSLGIDPADARTIYAGTYHLPWKTVDCGKNWKAIPVGMIDDSDVMSLRIDAQNPARVFASACSGIYRSENGGAAWIKLQGIPYGSRRTQSIAQDPRDPRVLYAGTTEGLWVTRDSGESWTRASPREWIVNAVLPISSAEGNVRVILGTEDQGVLISEDSATTFSASNTGFSHRVVALFAGDVRTPQRLIARIAGNGTGLLESKDAGRTWHALPGEEPKAGIEKLFSAETGWWASLRGGGAVRYDDSSSRWVQLAFLSTAPARTRKNPAVRSGKQQRTAPKADPRVLEIRVSGARVYMATSDGLWMGELAGLKLRRATSAGLPGTPHGLDVDPASTELWGVTEAGVFHSTDDGRTWAAETKRPAPAAPLWVRVLPSPDEGSILLGTQSGVYIAPRAAVSAWRLLQSGLPSSAMEIPLIYEERIAVAGRTGGIYLSSDGGKSWQRLDSWQEDGVLAGIAGDGHGGLIVGSRTEGVLHWVVAGAEAVK
jgi:photosystem II stability/assembly factor-like uncharacterized protein